MAERRLVRVFLSSPEDVLLERHIAEAVLRRLSGEFAQLELETISSRLEHEPSAEIPPPSAADIVLVVLWSQLGVSLPKRKHFTGAISGRIPVTATEWEFEEALAARRGRGAPSLLLFRKTAPALTEMADRNAVLQRLKDQEAVAGFFARWLPRRGGEPGSTWSAFADAAEFEELLLERIRPVLRALLPLEPDGDVPASDTPKNDAPGPNPFRGFRPFGREDAALFFGRTRAKHELRELLAKRLKGGTPFVLLAGSAGSGRTSLLQAGLLAEFQTLGALPGIGAIRLAELRLDGAQENPLAVLAEAIFAPSALPRLRAGPDDAADPAATLSAMLDKTLRARLRRALTAAAGKSSKLLIAIDGLERIFAAKVSPKDRETFAVTLEALAQSGEVLFVATLRSDLLEDLRDVPALARLAGDGVYHLAAPGPAEIGQIVRGPAAVAGLHFEAHAGTGEKLDDLLAAEAGRMRDSLPLLQFTLGQLWHRRQPGGLLTWEAHEKLGGLAGAIAACAEEVQGKLSDPARDALPAVLRRLMTVGPEPEAKVTIRTVALDSFAEGSTEREAVEAFRADGARLLVTEAAPEGTMLRFAHELLVVHWPLVREQVEQERAERLRARLLPALIQEAAAQPYVAAAASVPLLAAVGFFRRRNRAAAAAIVAVFLAVLTGSVIYAFDATRELAVVQEANTLDREATAARHAAALALRDAEVALAGNTVRAERADRARDGEDRRQRTRLVSATLAPVAMAARTASVAEDETGTAINVQAASALAGLDGDQARIITPILIDAGERLGIVTDPSLRRILSYRLMHQLPTADVLRDGINSVMQIGSSAWILPEGSESARIENSYVRSYAFAPDRSTALLFTDDDRILVTDRRGQVRYSFDTGRLSFSGEVLRAPSANARGMRPLRDYAVGFLSSPGGSYWIIVGTGGDATPYRSLTLIEPVTGTTDTRPFTEAWRPEGSCGDVMLDNQRVTLGMARGRIPSRVSTPQADAPARTMLGVADFLCPQLGVELRVPASEVTLLANARRPEAEFWGPYQRDRVPAAPQSDDLPGEAFSPQDAEQAVPGGAAAMDEFTGGTSLSIGDARYVFYPRRSVAGSLGICAIGPNRPRCIQSFCGENCPADLDAGGALYAILGGSLDSAFTIVDLQEMRYLPVPVLPREGVSISFSPRSGDLTYGTANRQIWRFRPGPAAASPVRRQLYRTGALGRWDLPDGAERPDYAPPEGAAAGAFGQIAALEPAEGGVRDAAFFLDVAARRALRCARDPRSFEGERAYLGQELACLAADGRVVILSPERRYIRWISDPIEGLAYGNDARRDWMSRALQVRFAGEPGETPDRPIASLVLLLSDRLVVLDYAGGFVLLSLTPDQLPPTGSRDGAIEQFLAARIDEEGRVWLRTSQRELLRSLPLGRTEITDRVGGLTAALERRTVRSARARR